MHFCCSHYISPCFLSTSPFHSLSLSLSLFCSLFLSLSLSLALSLSLSLSLSISPPSFSLWLRDTCHLVPFTKYSLLGQPYLFHAKSCHSSYKIHQLFTDSILRLPSSELLEKRIFRSRANRPLVLTFIFPKMKGTLKLRWLQAPFILQGTHVEPVFEHFRLRFREPISDVLTHLQFYFFMFCLMKMKNHAAPTANYRYHIGWFIHSQCLWYFCCKLF